MHSNKKIKIIKQQTWIVWRRFDDEIIIINSFNGKDNEQY
jgi:hypothetical protein